MPDSPVPEADRAALAREGRRLTAYLLGTVPDEYVISRYTAAHARIPFRMNGTVPDRLDVLLLRGAHGGRWRARAADAYARMFRPHGILRQKLVLLLAILETTSPAGVGLTRGGDTGPAGAVLRLAGTLVGFSLALLIGLVLYGPVHLAAGRNGGAGGA
ncbi:MAG: hypothetical protein AB7Q69_18765 [Gemmatimonadales bacterium]